MWELFEDGVYFIQLEPEIQCGNNSRAGRIQGITAIPGFLPAHNLLSYHVAASERLTAIWLLHLCICIYFCCRCSVGFWNLHQVSLVLSEAGLASDAAFTVKEHFPTTLELNSLLEVCIYATHIYLINAEFWVYCCTLFVHICTLDGYVQIMCK